MAKENASGKDKAPIPQKRSLRKSEIKTILIVWSVIMAALLYICGNCARPGRGSGRGPGSNVLFEAGANAPAPNMEITNNRISAVIDKIAVDIYAGKIGQGGSRLLGSGIVISRQCVLTNRHVAANAGDIFVTVYTGRITSYPVVVYKEDPLNDLAVLQVTNNVDFPATAAIGDSDAVDVGDIVFALGDPSVSGSPATSGMIIDKSFSGAVNGQAYNSMFRTNMEIYPGTCGGPLVSINGEVIGITNSAPYASNNFVGIGYALPINRALQLIANNASGQAPQTGPGALMAAAYSPIQNKQGNPYSLI